MRIGRAAVLRDDVRRELVLDRLDPIPELQLVLLQSLDLQEVAAGGVVQGFDRGIEVAVLLHQSCQR